MWDSASGTPEGLALQEAELEAAREEASTLRAQLQSCEKYAAEKISRISASLQAAAGDLGFARQQLSISEASRKRLEAALSESSSQSQAAKSEVYPRTDVHLRISIKQYLRRLGY